VIIAYHLAFIAILIHLSTLSRFNHKYLWMTLALSQVALTLAHRASKALAHEFAHPAE
jgi:hypothetical protein